MTRLTPEERAARQQARDAEHAAIREFHIRKTLSELSPLTDEKRQYLARLLRGGR